jgi:hypothetical protein
MRRLFVLLLSLGFPLIAQSQTRTVRIGVLGIFHPRELTLAADQTEELLISAADQRIFLQSGSPCGLLRIRSSGDSMLLSCGSREILERDVRASGRNQQCAGLVVTLPGKIKRRYQGVLELKTKNGELVPVIAMGL